MPSRAAGACFLLMGFSSGGEAEKKNSHSTSGCTTIPFLHWPGYGIDGETRPAL